jgi:hypothetical protein
MKSSVKNTLIAAAVASILGTGVAAALPPSATINYTFYAGGGSAQTNAVFWAVTQNFTAGTIDSYTDASGGGNSSNYRIISGTTSAAIGSIPSGSNILFYYRESGGSFPNGILPQVGSGSTLAYPPIPTPGNTTATGNAYPNPTYILPASYTNNQIPDWGVSDLEVPMFNFADNLNGTTPLTASQVSAIQQDGIYDNLFGVAVTDTVYSAKTSFTKQEVVGILSGQFSDWSQLNGDNGSPLTAGPIALLDRGSGSGTKAAGNQYFLTYPGGIATGGAVTPGSVNSSTVNNYTGTSLVLPVTAYQDVKEGSSGSVVSDLNAANVGGARAIAILGLEYPPALNQPTSGSGKNVSQYSFVKIDGVGPDTGGATDNINGSTSTKYTNVVTGAYDFFYQNSFNTRTGFLTNGTANAAWAGALKIKFQSKDISGANASKPFPQAVPGLLLDPKIIGSQIAGVVTGTRAKKSTAPLQPVYDATTTITYGTDPL